MVNTYQKKILILAIFAGEIMMQSGAEIYRVEDTITRICKACGIHYIEVFATPTGIFISIDKGGENDDTLTYIKRIKGTETDLHKISLVNEFSREFTTTDLSVEDGMERLRQIDKEKSYPLVLRVIGAALVSSFFCLIFGGNTVDFSISVFTGAISYLLSGFFRKVEPSAFIRGFCCCASSTFLALIATSVFPASSYDAIIIGTIMIFVPGVSITNSIRDFLSGDMLSGLAKLTEALLTAVSLAAGAGVILKLWDSIGGVLI